MGEPLLGVRIPDQMGRQTEGYRAPGPGGTQLAVVLQAFDDPLAQSCLAAISALYVGAGVRLLAVEAADGPISPTAGKTDIGQLIATEDVSAGVLSLLNAGEAEVDVWGVDEVSLIPPSHRSMAAVSSARPHRDDLFRDSIRPLLEEAQRQYYADELVELRRARLGVYEAQQPLSEQVRLARAGAQRAGLHIRDFPLVARFLEITEKEKTLKPGRAQAQQEEFLKRVVGRANSWHRPAGKNRIDIDLRKAAPVLQFWMEETGQSVEEFSAGFNRPNLEPILLACKEWYDSWFSTQATSGASHAFFEQLMRLALRLEVPYFDLRDFREKVAQSRDFDALRIGLEDELDDLVDALIDVTGARALGEVEDQMDLIHRMLQLAVGPRDAEAKVNRVTTLGDAIVKLLAVIVGGAPGREEQLGMPHALQPVEESLEAAKEFLRLSRKRSEHMVARTLELMAQRMEDRAVLAVGGFHSRAISRVMDDYPHVSWAIIMPRVDVEAAWRQHHQRF